jgi:hypothetical protein
LFRFRAQPTERKTQQRIHKKTVSELFEFSFEMASLVPFCFREARSARSTGMNAKNISYWAAVASCVGSVVCGTCRAPSPILENQQAARQGEKTEHLRADSPTVEKNSSSVRQPVAPSENRLGLALLKNLANDQKAIWTSSFPSSHATTAWAIASVSSHEYPGPFTKILAYGAATAITYARVRGEKHFPADAFVGTGIGWLTGWQVYRTHHNTELGGGIAENLSDTPLVETDRTPNQMVHPTCRSIAGSILYSSD